MTKGLLRKRSRFLSRILRHNPDLIDLTLDNQGWADVSELITCAERHGISISEALIHEIVATNDKRRFSLSDDDLRIRANQGHSLPILLDLDPVIPPNALYHGTAAHSLDSIKKKGLIKGRRHHVHLSLDSMTAEQVGKRHGQPVILKIDAQRMNADGFIFFLSVNGVWLIESVPAEYIELPQ